MKKSPHSVTLSRITTVVLLVIVILCFILLPIILRHYFTYRRMPFRLYAPLLTLCYLCALCVSVALLRLLKLLSRIDKGLLFDRENTALLRDLSVCCITISLLTAIGTVWYFPCIIVAIAAAFMFLILRVLQTVFIAAAEIKDENDMTI